MNKIPLTKNSIFKLIKTIKYFNLGNELLKLEKSDNRFLDQNIISKINLPPFKNSAVDGYSVLKSDILKKNNLLILKDRIVAGCQKSIILKKGETARIFTGAKMPLNSETVVMQENVNIKKNKIYIKKMPAYKENCRFTGEDIKKGRKIFSKGNKIDITKINLIAAIGKKNILVKKKINVGYYTSGDELISITEKLKGSQINNSNFYSLNSLLKKSYVNSNYLGILKDNEDSITRAFLKNVKKYNVIITTGGASVGEEDHLIKVIKKIGKVYFWKAAIKPGRPLAIGKIKDTIIICLPGNPVSVHLLYGMIIRPFLEYLCCGVFIPPRGIQVKSNFSMKKKNKRLEWLRVNIKENKKELYVNKFLKQGSGMISSMAFTDGILEIPENISFISKDDFYLFYSFESLF